MCVSYFSSDSDKSKDWEHQTNQMKQAFEKQLQSERTLKTQVTVFKEELKHLIIFTCLIKNGCVVILFLYASTGCQ